MTSNHEQDDTRMILHTVNLRGHVDNVVVSARDTDVLVLLVSHYARVRPTKVFLWAGTSKKSKFIPIEEVQKNLTPSCGDSLLPFHAITGCDNTSYIFGHSKRSAWDVFAEHTDLLSLVRKNGELMPATMSSAGKFVCLLYKTPEETLDLAREQMFGKVSQPEKLPPTSGAFHQHLLRCHYQ